MSAELYQLNLNLDIDIHVDLCRGFKVYMQIGLPVNS